MTIHDPEPDLRPDNEPADETPDALEPAPASPETEHIEEEGEPLGANFA